MTTPATTIDTNAAQLSYATEGTWAVLPVSTFQQIRFTGESLSFNKTRTRPQEINSYREAIQGVTTSVTAGGTINYDMSYGTFDNFIESAINANTAFSTAAVSISGVAADITLTMVSNVSCTLSSATASKFANVAANSYIRTLGFGNSVNNGIFYVSTKAANAQVLTMTVLPSTATGVVANTVTETPPLAVAQVRAGNVRNGTAFNSLHLQKKFNSSLGNQFFRYPGCFVSGMTIGGGVGQMLAGTITILAQQEINSNASSDTGGIVAPTSGSVMNPIAGFGGVYANETSIGVVDSFNLIITSTSAAGEYGMGSALAQGILQGSIEITGTMKMFFQNATLYNAFISETQQRLAFIMKDNVGNAYVIQLFNVFLNNPKVMSPGTNQAVYATFDIEANPIAATGITTIGIDKLPST